MEMITTERLQVILLLILHFIHGNNSARTKNTFWQITDLHMDQMYDHKNGDKSNWCQTSKEQQQHQKELRNNGSVIISDREPLLHRFGEYSCDSPFELVNSSIRQMQKLYPDPNFIIWTGDSTTHAKDPNTNQSVHIEVVYETERRILSLFQELFPKVPIVAVLGNHDSFPPDFFPDTKDQPTNFYRDFLIKSNWTSLLPHEQQLEFMNCGYYKRKDIIPGKTFLSLNTNLYYKTNNSESDPCGQFYWLNQELKSADNNSIFIVSHVPPGFYERNGFGPYMKTKDGNATYNYHFASLITKYGHKIYAQIYGHTHTDTFRLFTESYKDWNKASSAALIAPSVTPLVEWTTSTNPSIRYYEYNQEYLMDYQQFYMKLYEGTWSREYRFTETYGVPNLSLASLIDLFQKLVDDMTAFQTYYNYNTGLHKEEPCGLDCRQIHLCGIANVYTKEYYKCLNDFKLVRARSNFIESNRKKSTTSSLSIVEEVEETDNYKNKFYCFLILYLTTSILIAIIYICLKEIQVKRRVDYEQI